MSVFLFFPPSGSCAEGAVAVSGLWRAAALRLSWKVDAIRRSSFLHVKE